MPLPVRTALADIEAICRYLIAKPAGASPAELGWVDSVLDADVLTIGFARRFATYKRAGLLFSDIDRLARMLWDADRPLTARAVVDGLPGRELAVGLGQRHAPGTVGDLDDRVRSGDRRRRGRTRRRDRRPASTQRSGMKPL